ncbi:DUF3027 domain-containing protein [Actinomyces wuliandei]|uniref:DUF3027 domain-containing protein n=1 Tax=Actinomyces wuliandei TaxID=2057743 RepID=UPI0015D5E03C|nr:DUF3027 domain-containing protein [Actinomyces wuliandei]
MTETVPDTIPRPGTLPAAPVQAQAARDKPLSSAAAVDLARRALAEVAAADAVGDHVAAAYDAERLVTHLFDCAMPGYRGWRWAVTLSRPPRSRTATVCEVGLLPGEDALLAPAWVPWADRLRPEDLAAAGRAPAPADGDADWPAEEEVPGGGALTLEALRPRSRRVRGTEGGTESLARAAQRWYGSAVCTSGAPRAPGSRGAGAGEVATCSAYGFFLPLTGAVRAVLGEGAAGAPASWQPRSQQADSPEGCGGEGCRESSGGYRGQDRSAQPAGGAQPPPPAGPAAGGAVAEKPGEAEEVMEEPVEPTEEDRAASARAAVMDLASGLTAPATCGDDTGQDAPGRDGGTPPATPWTLEDLEAVLPRH